MELTNNQKGYINMINLNDYQVGQKLYFYNMESAIYLRVERINKKTITMKGPLHDQSKNKLSEAGMVKQCNDYYTYHICSYKTYRKLKEQFSVGEKFNELFMYEPEGLSTEAKKKMISILYQDKNK
ncbi:MAG: hypothetical protein GY714_18230 [Desulfobacterales bacterium]|nr:hypothetical protein [Desulfobacterales bacterium]